jgi:hypothetical protein
VLNVQKQLPPFLNRLIFEPRFPRALLLPEILTTDITENNR